MTTDSQSFLAEMARTIKRNPALSLSDTAKLQMKVGNLTALLRQFYDAGVQQGRKCDDSLFGKIFGGL